MERRGQAWFWCRVGCTAEEICGRQVHRGVTITQSRSIQLNCDEDIWADGIADCMVSISRGGWGGLYWGKAARDRSLDTGSKTSQGKEGSQCLDHSKDPQAMQLVLVQREVSEPEQKLQGIFGGWGCDQLLVKWLHTNMIDAKNWYFKVDGSQFLTTERSGFKYMKRRKIRMNPL